VGTHELSTFSEEVLRPYDLDWLAVFDERRRGKVGLTHGDEVESGAELVPAVLERSAMHPAIS